VFKDVVVRGMVKSAGSSANAEILSRDLG
jgi:hypothetical protein